MPLFTPSPRVPGFAVRAARSLLLFAAPVGLPCASSSGAAIEANASASVAWVDNFSRASDAVDERSVGLLEVGGSVGSVRQLAPNLSGFLRLEGRASFADRFSNLGEFEVAAAGGFGRKLGLGPRAARCGLELAFRGHLPELSPARGVAAEARVFVVQPFGEGLSLRLGAEAVERDASAGAFDVAHQSLDAELAWDVTDRVRVSLGAGRRFGQFTAGCSAARFAAARSGGKGAEVAARFREMAFAATPTFAPDWVTYRIRGEIDSLRVEVSPALSDRTAVFLRGEHHRITSVLGSRYDQSVASLGLVHAF